MSDNTSSGTALEVKTSERLAEIKSAKGGLRLRTMADYWTMANAIHRAGMGPRDMNAAQIMIAIQMGAEVGMSPMSALKNTAVVNGRPTIWGDALLALALKSGLLEDIQEVVEGAAEKLVARCTVKRKGLASPVVREYSVADAKQAGLWGKKGPWQQYPKRMLAMRARGFALRDAFPDALGGFTLTEEARDTEAVAESESRSEAFLGRLRENGAPGPSEVAGEEPVDVPSREMGEDPAAEVEGGAPVGIDPEEVRAREMRDAGLFDEEEDA